MVSDIKAGSTGRKKKANPVPFTPTIIYPQTLHYPVTLDQVSLVKKWPPFRNKGVVDEALHRSRHQGD